MTLTLDEDTVRDDDPEHYEFVLDVVRTEVRRVALSELDSYDPTVELAEVTNHGVTYHPSFGEVYYDEPKS
jgi:hypothetical protein